MMRLCLFSTLLFAGGCIGGGASAGGNADASIAGIRTHLRDLSTALAQYKSEVRAGGDVHENDDWTLRLLVLGILLLGLSYPVGKIVWMAVLAMMRQKKTAEPGYPSPAVSEYYAFRDALASRAATAVQA